MNIESLCIKGAERPQKPVQPHVNPIYATSTYVYDSIEKAASIIHKEEPGYIYGRWESPNVDAVEATLSALEGYGLETNGQPLQARSLLFGSGMAAISTTLLALLKPGDAVITQGNLYGATTELMNSLLKEHQIQPVYINLHDLAAVEKTIAQQQAARLLYIETPGNPTLNCCDLEALSGLAKKHGLTTVVDSTFATPVLQQPFRWGIDFVVHSTTKFLNGHGNALGGVVIGRDANFMNDRLWHLRKLTGGMCSPFDAWLLENGLKTLPLRVERHCQNAMAVASFLEKLPQVSRVYYPGLPSHPDHAIAKKQMRAFGGVLAFELKGGYEAALQMMRNIRFITLTASLGTLDTLIQHPASVTHARVPAEQRRQFGISDGLIRLSVGIENVDDINSALAEAVAPL